MKTTLFRMDASSHVREWTIWVEHFANRSLVHIRHGLNGGKQVINSTPFLKCTHEADAKVFMNSKINYMRDRRGYTEDIPKSVPYLPMLLQRYKDHVFNLPDKVFIQTKLNGLRCLASKFWVKSRTNDHFTAIRHLPLDNLPEDIVLDGELYIHGYSLQNLTSLITPDKPALNSFKVNLFVYDIVCDLPFEERIELLEEIMQELSVSTPEIFGQPINPHDVPDGPGSVYQIPSYLIDKEEVDTFYNKFLSEGYEGAVIRTPRGRYSLASRSSSVLKYKPLQRMNVKIIDIIPMERDPQQGRLVLQNPMGGTFRCSIRATHFLRNLYLKQKHQYIGRLCEVEYEDYSDRNQPLKPIGIQIL